MSFAKGWKQRRAAAQHRDERARSGSDPYRTWANRQREIERVGHGLTTLVERHAALLAELKEVERRISVREYNAAAVGDTLIDSDDVTMRLRARADVLPALVNAARAAVEIERKKVQAEKATITARHAAEDAALAAVAAQEARAEAAATEAIEAVMAEGMPK